MAVVDRAILDSGVAATEAQLKQFLRDQLDYFDEVIVALASHGFVLKGDYSGATTYEMGDLVYNQEASWGYINATPGLGNAPPTLPTTANAHWQIVSRSPNKAGIGIHIQATDTEIPAGIVASYRVPFACTVYKWSIIGDVVGGIVFDIWKSDYTGAPPSVANSIVAAAKPTLSGAIKAESSTLTGWTTTLAEGDVLIFNIDSVSTLIRVDLTLFVKRTNA